MKAQVQPQTKNKKNNIIRENISIDETKKTYHKSFYFAAAGSNATSIQNKGGLQYSSQIKHHYNAHNKPHYAMTCEKMSVYL